MSMYGHSSLCEFYVVSVIFFFFQAEDGIRVHCVTGVQTCALPIFLERLLGRAIVSVVSAAGHGVEGVGDRNDAGDERRSEERRVGKECISRWSPYD